MMSNLKQAPLIVKLLVFFAIAVAALLACGAIGAVLYLTLN